MFNFKQHVKPQYRQLDLFRLKTSVNSAGYIKVVNLDGINRKRVKDVSMICQ